MLSLILLVAGMALIVLWGYLELRLKAGKAAAGSVMQVVSPAVGAVAALLLWGAFLLRPEGVVVWPAFKLFGMLMPFFVCIFVWKVSEEVAIWRQVRQMVLSRCDGSAG